MPDEKESKEYVANREALSKKSEEIFDLRTTGEVKINELVEVAKKSGNPTFALLFGRGNNFERDQDANLPANFGKGSFSGVNVRDLEANVVRNEYGKKEEIADVLKVDETINHPAMPLLRYINLPSGSIEIKKYEQVTGDALYTASRTLDGKTFTVLCGKVTLKEMFALITSRSMGWETKTVEEDFASHMRNKVKALETSMEDVSVDQSDPVERQAVEHSHSLTHADHNEPHEDCLECVQEAIDANVFNAGGREK